MREADLYPFVQDWLDATFPLSRRGRWYETHRKSLITAQLDWIDGGAWMRPDLALIHVHRRKFEAAASLDLYTFEVKPEGTQALPGLHQTLAHGRFADFVVLVAPKTMGPTAEVQAQAIRFGVGLVLFENVQAWGSYEIRVEPQRTTPDPDLRDQFLTAALDQDRSTDEVISWLKSS